ncbi:hypothetical protein [Spartinivicinus poritis]|uniref:Uncharacterized protein n=1 Tax=Spartinivicinus poritis TaxID=2994640 RepID=A0ABT5UFT2_9GAMM|nr:hypothetical protein [Spartinivicinus sp. A2-2]MDE1464323.1 hypothetical protein [Spartinivicinus sp. A2-2]
MRSLWYTALFSVVFSVVSVSTHAKTPDGMTPAEETVCDVLIDATPGLFGLCNAYCEAQDLGPDSNKNSMEQLLSNYNKKKTENDPDMPCLAVVEPEPECPCCHLVKNLPDMCTTVTDDGVFISVIFEGGSASVNLGRGACSFTDADTMETVRMQSAEDIEVCYNILKSCPPIEPPRDTF